MDVRTSFLPYALCRYVAISPIRALVGLVPVVVGGCKASLTRRHVEPVVETSDARTQSSRVRLFHLGILPLGEMRRLVLGFSIVDLGSLDARRLSVGKVSTYVVYKSATKAIGSPSDCRIVQSQWLTVLLNVVRTLTSGYDNSGCSASKALVPRQLAVRHLV